mgnify:CR=1 FL=1
MRGEKRKNQLPIENKKQKVMKTKLSNMVKAVFRVILNIALSIGGLLVGFTGEIVLGVVQIALSIICAILTLIVFLMFLLWLFTL